MPKRCLIVSSYPPMPCGIGAYAEQQAQWLRRHGAVVDVFSPPEGDGDFQGILFGGWNPLRLARVLWAYDEAVIHYVPSFFYHHASRGDRLKTSLALFTLALLFRRRVKFVIHETDYKVEDPLAGRGARVALDRWTYKLSGGVEFHTTRERAAFARRYGMAEDNPRLQVSEHDRYFTPRVRMTREEARRALGLPEDGPLFLCIGFVQPHKGFDRAARAMTAVKNDRALLRIVGSVRINWEPALEYARELHRVCAADPRSKFVEEFVTDEKFDTWITASDYVIIPYREIWTSGVLGRARLFGKPAIAADVGALREQLHEGSRVFQSDEELAEIMSELTTEGVRPKIAERAEPRK